jgi:hypothetical protein
MFVKVYYAIQHTYNFFFALKYGLKFKKKKLSTFIFEIFNVIDALNNM